MGIVLGTTTIVPKFLKPTPYMITSQNVPRQLYSRQSSALAPLCPRALAPRKAKRV